MNINNGHVYSTQTFQEFIQKDPNKNYQVSFFDKKGNLRTGEFSHAFTHFQGSYSDKLNNGIEKTKSIAARELEFAENIAVITTSKDPNDKSIQIAATLAFAERIRAHLAKNKQLNLTHADGRIVSHDVNNISVRTFTTEEFSALERALNQFFASVQDARKKTMESKEKGGNEVDYKAQYPTVEGAKIKNTNKFPKEQKKLVDPDTIRKTAINIVAKNIAKSATQEKQKQLDQDKEDKIKETELQRSERRQEILNESKENQQEKIAINKEDQKIHAKTKHQKI
jgi:hypothetical protein